MHADSLIGCLVGMAVGDALGLPSEGLSPRRARRLFPNPERYHFLLGHGMFSDDTEHACMTGQALLVSGGDPDRFIRNLAWRMRWWLLGIPPAVGKATLKACLKLWLGFSTKSSGVWSAGNGPAMRAPIIGVCYTHQPDRIHELIRRSTRLTHRDPKAEWGALAIAISASLAVETSERVPLPEEMAQRINKGLPAEASELSRLINQAASSVAANQTTEEFADALGLQRGVTGYMYHTVPVVLHSWMRFPDDFRAPVQAVIRCGGDTDTTAALVGALAGARLGQQAIPQEWRQGLCEWPRDLRWMERLGRELERGLSEGAPRRGVPLNVLGIVARNLMFDIGVFLHLFRRMLPPY